MSVFQHVSDPQGPSGAHRLFLRRFLIIFFLGGGTGALVALGLYVTKAAYVVLLPFGLMLLLPAICLKNFRLYWLAIFLLSLQFSISKNLNDGLAALQELNIDAFIPHFTFEITATDLVLLILLAIWANDRIFHRKAMRFPPVTWLAVGYLGVCLLSTAGASSPYLGFVDMAWQIKCFIVYLFAVNCLDSKSALRVIAIVGVIILVTQAGATVARFETGYLTPITFGETHQDSSQIRQYLEVDRSDPGSWLRAFGTLGSPGSTIHLCMMVIPFALFLCVPNAMVRIRVTFLALTAFGILGLVLTFARVYYITTAVQIVLAFSIMVRDRMLKRNEAILIVLIGLTAAAVASSKLYKQFTIREDSVSVRLLQYEASANMILDHPFLGVGLNNGIIAKKKYNNLTYNPYDAKTQFDQEPTNDLYLSLASEIGVFGAALFVGFFARVTFLAWRQSRRSTDPEVRLAANALVVAFVGVAVTGLMDYLHEYPFLVFLWLYAGVSLTLPTMARDGETADPALGHRSVAPARDQGSL
jgi:hypothetical protein